MTEHEQLMQQLLEELEWAVQEGTREQVKGFPMPTGDSTWVFVYLARGSYAEVDISGVFVGKDGMHVWFEASCDTTGWDCRMMFAWGIERTAELALRHIHEDVRCEGRRLT